MATDDTFKRGMERLRHAMQAAAEQAAEHAPDDAHDVNVVVARNVGQSNAVTAVSATQDVSIRQGGERPDGESGER